MKDYLYESPQEMRRTMDGKLVIVLLSIRGCSSDG